MMNGQVPKALSYRFLNYLTIPPRRMLGRSPTLAGAMGQYSRTRFQLDAFRVGGHRGIFSGVVFECEFRNLGVHFSSYDERPNVERRKR